MTTFLFFIKDEKLVILDKNEIDKNKLDNNIYKKLDIEIQAENEKDAIKKLKKENTDKYSELKEFIWMLYFLRLFPLFYGSVHGA